MKRTAIDLTGEMFRKAGILAMVFDPVREGLGGQFSMGSAILIFAGALTVWAIGVGIEQWRRQ